MGIERSLSDFCRLHCVQSILTFFAVREDMKTLVEMIKDLAATLENLGEVIN